MISSAGPTGPVECRTLLVRGVPQRLQGGIWVDGKSLVEVLSCLVVSIQPSGQRQQVLSDPASSLLKYLVSGLARSLGSFSESLTRT
jgi:hypothetical protein